jgi:hypothetical protein
MREQSNRRREGMLTKASIYLLIPIAVVALSASAQAQKIEGTIPIKQKQPKRRVTSSFSICPRGTTVELGNDTAIMAGNG